ncbi:DEAD/DEAH box helicase family protein, partial [Myxococcota bacterium]|nr:DEAD/DEAH box helicase family protein [Myxococcota bacterium]
MSVFSELPSSAWIASNAHAFAIRDRFPVSPGHTLVITKRADVRDWFDATDEERRAIFELVDDVKRALDRATPRPDGYNLGINVGEAAGQTVMHLHVHVIPRYANDVEDPRGGVRHVIPGRGNYPFVDAPETASLAHDRAKSDKKKTTLEKIQTASPLATGGEADPLARQVLPLFALADDVAIVAAFVQTSGLERIEPELDAALARGATIRILTGDYLEITQVEALKRLLDLERTATLEDDEGDDAPTAILTAPRARGKIETRVVEVDRLPGNTRAFHPKSWRFESDTFGLAFVGSSNLSRSALDTGIEWNLRVDRHRDPKAYEDVRAAFEHRWRDATPLDDTFIETYAARARRTPARTPHGELDPEPLPKLDAPHDVQTAALAALRSARQRGRKRALVVLATGLGKTLLAVHDYRQLVEERGGRRRLLFLAHRRELLRQAAAQYRRLLQELDPEATVGMFVEEHRDLHKTLVFASVAKLARKEHLEALKSEKFDYVVVDEVHHAAAESYRRILDALSPGFLLGLTATPDRADNADILGLFDDFEAYRAGIDRGIELGRLVPFHYFGVKDDIDYDHIPWRNRRFDPEALTKAAETEARMKTLARAWEAHPGTRTLVFCCSITHALFVRRWLSDRGLRVAAVFSGEGTDDRDEALRDLDAGHLDALCAVDVFNEGIDLPKLDRVVMLRPTESSTIFLQQLGRGLRYSEGKHALTVIDFVGNHRIFLERLRTLLSLAPSAAAPSVHRFLGAGAIETLPGGCRVELELEAKELLERLFRPEPANAVESAYRHLRTERGRRPKLGELQRLGYLPSRLRERHGGWIDFVASEGDLTPAESRVVEVAGDLLRDLEDTDMVKSFKMVTLEVLLEHGALFDGLDLKTLATAAHD